MRQWLTILLLLCGAITSQAADERKSASCRPESCTTVLTGDNDPGASYGQVPLLATSCPGAVQLSGTGHETIRGNRHSGSCSIAAMRGHTDATACHPSERCMHVYRCTPPNVRGGDRYIYYLRRIII